MKSIKMLGLTALAALMAMAFIGSSSAMAESTALCKEDPVNLTGEVCPEAKRIHHVHETTLTGAPGLLLTSIVEILCDVLFLGDVQNANNLGSPLEILGNFTYTNCMTASGGSCTVTETSSDTKLNVLKLGHELADVNPQGIGGSFNIHCSVINCTYDWEGLEAHALGPLLSGTETNGQVRLEEHTTHRVSGFCPETAKLDLLTTPLEVAYIGKGGKGGAVESTALCKEDLAGACPEAKRIHHVHETTLTGAPGLLLSSIVEILCDVLFLGDVTSTANLGNPLQILGNFTYTNCMTASNGSCTVTEKSSDIKLNILKLGHELADVTPQGVGGEVNAHCGFLINCTYDGEGLTAHGLGPLLAEGETNGQVRIEEKVTHRVSGVCPETAKLDLLTTPLEATYIAE